MASTTRVIGGILLAFTTRSSGFDVIGAGISHTGEDELAKALDILGFNSYNSGKDLPNTHAEWIGVADIARKAGKKGKKEDSDFAPLYKIADAALEQGHRAIVSSPAAFYALELRRHYPKAKLILTVHEDTNAWFYEMMKGTQIALHRDMVRGEFHRLEECPLPPADADIAECIADYEKHNEKIRAKTPRGQLLEFKSSDGWEPLCEFLGVPVPKEPFPANNHQKGMSTIAIVGIATGMLFLILVLVAVLITSDSPAASKKAMKKAQKEED